jgi:CHAD domain-containing protein
MAKAGIKAVRYHYKRLRKSELGARKEDDIESPHQMRVATRRLRSVMKSFGPFFPKKEVACLVAELRKATKLLGPVRDYDVLLHNLETYCANLPESERHWLETLEATWKAPREAARKRLIAYFDSNCYKGLNQACEAILKHSPSKRGKKGQKDPNSAKRVRHAVPRLVWEKYENVWCYENLLEGAPVEVYHQLRIECKRLRYTLELFQEILGPAGEEMVAKVTAAQEHLGELQDADVAIELLEGFLKKRTQGRRGKRIPPEAVTAVKAYLGERKAKRDRQIETFPNIWEDLAGEDFHQLLTESLGGL